MKKAIVLLMVGATLMGMGSNRANANELSKYDIDNIGMESVQFNSLGEQLDSLYENIGEEFNIDYVYVKMLHILSGGQAVYIDRNPNVYRDLTIESIKGPFDIVGANQVYENKSSFEIPTDSGVIRPNKYYIPDAAHNVTGDIVKLMSERKEFNRGDMQKHFDSLDEKTKTNILFYESVLLYTGTEDISGLYLAYEEMLNNKQKEENVLTVNEYGAVVLKKKYREIFEMYGIDGTVEIGHLTKMLSFDAKLAYHGIDNNIRDEYIMPYEIGEASRENMILAASSLVGKVRYVWAGGHLTAGNIRGINPVWKEFNDKYGREEGEPGYNRSIRPRNSWCPIHGESTKDDGCIWEQSNVNDFYGYVRQREGTIDDNILQDRRFRGLIGNYVDMDKIATSSRLDGLDCSGYTSWVMNQIDTTRDYDSTAKEFIKHSGMKEIKFGSKMLPGDIFAWNTHIVIVVGQIEDGSGAYVTLEAVPNMVKYGVIHYGNASEKDIENAVGLAEEANKLIGNVNNGEEVKVHNMRDIRNRHEYGEIGRFDNGFIDEDIILEEYNKRFKDMTAYEVIDSTIELMPMDYISGLDNYGGEMFNAEEIKEIKVKRLNNSDIELEVEEKKGMGGSSTTVGKLVGLAK